MSSNYKLLYSNCSLAPDTGFEITDPKTLASNMAEVDCEQEGFDIIIEGSDGVPQKYALQGVCMGLALANNAIGLGMAIQNVIDSGGHWTDVVALGIAIYEMVQSVTGAAVSPGKCITEAISFVNTLQNM